MRHDIGIAWLVAAVLCATWSPGLRAESPDAGKQTDDPDNESATDVRAEAEERVRRSIRAGRAEASLWSSGTMQPNTSVGGLVHHTRETPFDTLKGELTRPISEKPTFDFGKRQQEGSISYVRHTGLTWKAEVGTPIRSVASGTVSWVGIIEGYGPVVIIDHGDGYISLYAHLSETEVDAGTTLAAGERIGRVGRAGSMEGPKLYFELRRGEQPIDPSPWLKPLDGRGAPDAGGS